MSRHIVHYLAAAAVFFPLDMLWLGVVAKGFYRDNLGLLLLERPNWLVAAGFYLIYIAGLVVFAMARAADWREAAFYGALFGFFAYATYDLTNLATLKGFPAKLAMTDIAWGTFLSGVSAGGGTWIARALFGVAGGR